MRISAEPTTPATKRCSTIKVHRGIIAGKRRDQTPPPTPRSKENRHDLAQRCPCPAAPRTWPHPRGTRRAPLHHAPGGQPLGDRSDRARHRHDQAHRSRARGARDATARHAGALLPKLRHDVHRARPTWARSRRHRGRRLLPLVLRPGRVYL